LLHGVYGGGVLQWSFPTTSASSGPRTPRWTWPGKWPPDRAQPAQQPAPQQPAQQAPAPPTYTAIAGAYCANNSTDFQQYGWFDQGQSGWNTNSTGGYSGGGCNGKYTSVPMSGDANKDDGNSVVWTFNTGSVSSGSCSFSVYVPADGDIKAVGGDPAYYTVQNSSTPRSGTIASFTVNQVDNLGSWVGVGSYPLSNGQISVMLHTRGQDWTGNTKTYAHLAAAAIKATCTG
ncbi:hypothetical protein, partial [Kitasatospora sp. LaBMicrA B282]|uniref:hypothetical protein n=1 Tax=Kitasatospora sp. LaBMicrA B282 TaxID=3420949 RepID=UPI003D12DF8A